MLYAVGTVRLMMLTLLNRNEMSVGELAERVGAPMTTVSQHLSALKERRLVTARKDKQTVYYSLTDPRILEASILIRSVLIDGMKERDELANDVSPEGYRTEDSPNQSGEDGTDTAWRLQITISKENKESLP